MAEIEFNRQARIHITSQLKYSDDGSQVYDADIDKHTTLGIQYVEEYSEMNGRPCDRHIISGSMMLERNASDSGIQLGALTSSQFSCQIYYKNPVPPAPTTGYGLHLNSGQYIECLVGDYDEEQYFQPNQGFSNLIEFAGYIDSCVEDSTSSEVYTITAYDWAYYERDTDIIDWWNDFWSTNNTATIWDLMESFALTTHIIFSNSYSLGMQKSYFNNIPNIDLEITKNVEFEHLTIQEFLTWLGEILGVMFDPYCKSNVDTQVRGLRVIVLNSDTETAYSTLNNLEKGNSTFEQFTTLGIDGIEVYEGDQLVSSILEEDYVNPYKIYENKLFGCIVNRDLCLTNLLSAISEITYTPATLKLIVSEPSVKLGDMVKYINSRSETKYAFAFQIIYSGTLFVDEQIICNALGEKLQQENTTKYGSDADLTNIEQQIQHLEDDTVKVDPKLQTMSGEDLLTQDDEQILVKTKNNITDILENYVKTTTLESTVHDLLEYIREHDDALSDRINACVTSTELSNTLTSYLLKSDFDSTIKHYIWSAYMQYDNPSNFIVLRTVDTTLYQNDEIVRVSFAKNMGVVHMSIVLKVYAPIPSYNATTGEGKIFGINDFASMQYQIDRLTAQYAFDTMGSVGANQTAGARSFYFRPSDENDPTQGDAENVSYVINTYDAITPPSGSFTYIRLSATWLVLDEEE